MKKTLRTLKKILLVFSGILLLMMLLIYLFFKVPAIQNRVADKATKIASKSLNTRVQLGEILIVPPNKLLIKELYVEGADGDSLLSAGEISANISLFKLLRKKIEINRFSLDDAHINIRKNASDSTFNFAFGEKSPSSQPDTSKKSSWTFDIDEVELNHVEFGFCDNTLNNTYQASVGFLNLTIDSLNPEQTAFYIGAVDFRKSDIVIDYQNVSEEESTEETSLPRIAVSENVSLEDINLDFINSPSSQHIKISHLNLEIVPKELDLQNNRLAFKEISLHNSLVAFEDLSQDTATLSDQENPEEGGMPWTIEAEEIVFEKNTLSYVAMESPQSDQTTFNPKNVKVTDFSASISDLFYKEEDANVEIAHISFSEHDRFFLNELSGKFALNEEGLNAQDVHFLTPRSEMKFSLSSGKINFETISTTYQQIPFQLDLKNATTHYSDIHYFYQDSLLIQYQEIINELALSTRLSGAVSDLQIEKFSARISDELTATVKGHVAGLPEIKKANGKLSLKGQFQHGAEFMQRLPDSLLPGDLNIPYDILIRADISGDYFDAEGKLSVHSEAGNLLAKMSFTQDTIQQKEEYGMDLTARGLDLGAFYPLGDTVGEIYAQIRANGVSNGFTNPSFDAEMQIDTLNYMNYPYAGLSFEGSYADEVYHAKASIDDENIVFHFDGEANLTDSVPDLNFVFDMAGANFQALNLTEQDFRAGLKINSKINGNSPDNSNGHLSINDIVLVKENQRFELDSIVFRAKNEKELTHLTANSRLFNLDFEGNVKFSDISSSLWDHLNLFFKMDTIPVMRPGLPKKFNLSITVDDHPLLRELFIPDLTTFDGLSLDIVYNQNNSLLNVNSTLPPMAYNGIELDSTHLQIESAGEELRVRLISNGIERQPVFIPDLVFEARVTNNNAAWSFSINDIKGEKKYALAGRVSSESEAYRSVLEADSLRLNYAQWNISEKNAIMFYKDSIVVSDFELKNGAQSMVLKQENRQGVEYTKVVFDAFKLKTLTNMVTTIDLVDADVNGFFSFNKADTSLSSELTIQNLNLEGKPLFENITLDFDQNRQSVTKMSATLSQKKGGAEIQGKLITDEGRSSEATITFNSFTLDNFQPFFEEDLKKLSGNINGEIEVRNPAGDLQMNGHLSFADAEIAPKLLGTSFGIDKSELILDNNTIKLNQFTITDAKNQKATLDGEISELFSSNIQFDLDFESDNYTFLNAIKGGNELFYGNLTGDVSAHIFGSVEQPKVRLNTNIKAPSDFIFIVPSTESATVEREGVVVFMKDKEDPFNEILEIPKDTTDLEFSPGFDLDMAARISVDDKAKLTIIVDPASEEQLSIQGMADLNFNMTGGSQQTLTGRYLISNGKYTLTLYDVVKREFDINENSSITWTGDVMDAQADLSATYQVRTSAEGLIANEVSDMSEAKRRQLSQPYPFLVTLNISGALLKPELDFDISLPRGVNVPEIINKLNQINQNESEVNKQAFSLLVFGSFIQNNVSTSRPISYELNSAARSSISKILSTQLNRLAEKYIKGVNVNLKVDSYADYSNKTTRNTTNVKLDLRKQFFDDRLTVRVGGKVNIEGEQERSNNLQRVAGDVVVLYDLTEDGRFKLKGFNTTEYENMLEGELRKTGVGIIYNRDYYHFRNLFQADTLDRRRKKSDNRFDKDEKKLYNE